jgi:hypothetical protein
VLLGNADILRYSITDVAIRVIANGAQGYAAFVRKNQVIRYELIQGCTGQAFALIKHLAAGNDIGIRSWEAMLGYYEPNQESLATSYIHKIFSIRRRSLLAWHQEKISARSFPS